MGVVPQPALAGVWAPHTIEDLLQASTDVIIGKVAPGEFTTRTYECDYSLVGLPRRACPKILIDLEVQEALKGSLQPGTSITIMLDGIRSSISPDFLPEEPVVVFLTTNENPPTTDDPQRRTHEGQRMTDYEMRVMTYRHLFMNTPVELRGKVYHVVENRMGKWSLYPDGMLRHGRYEPDKRIPVPLSAEEVFGPIPPKAQPTVSIYEFRQYMKNRYGHQPPQEVVEEKLAKGEKIPNTGELTQKQMRQINRRHLQGELR
jgi:hypothetical protein